LQVSALSCVGVLLERAALALSNTGGTRYLIRKDIQPAGDLF
jgi:hypothetical protein